MGEEFLRVENVSKRFVGVQALRGVSFSIGRGEVVGLVGENGSGKSTVIKIISGVYEPDTGEIVVNGRRYRRLTPILSIREGVQVIYQDFLLFPNLSVAENIGITRVVAQRKRFVDWKRIWRIAQEALARVGVDIPLATPVGELSTADRQIIAIARALLEEAHLIIMDEPTTALTWREVQRLFHIVRELQRQGIAVLFVSHKLNEVKEISDRIIVFRDGQKVLDERAEQLDIATMEYAMTGRYIGEDLATIRRQEEGVPPLLEVRNLTLAPSFFDVSFVLHRGEILGITGLLGSGRTELARSLFGELPADSGEVYLEGKRVSIRSIQEAIALGIGYVPEDRINEGLFLLQPIVDNIAVCTVDALARRFGFIDGAQKTGVAREWVQTLDIRVASLGHPAGSLSGGNQQRVVLAKWLARRPRVLILNGPTVGVDVGSKAYIHNLIRSLAESGMGIVLISDDLPEILRTCHRVLLMKRGRIVREFLQGTVDEESLHRAMVGEGRE